MQAVVVTGLDGPEAVEIAAVPDPEPTADQVFIEVHAAGVSFPDLLMTRGEYQIKPPLPFTPGAEVAGIVRSAPAGAHVRPGDRVAAFPGGDGFAELVAVEPDRVFGLPDRLSFAAGAALPMNYLTVEFALGRRGHLQPGETVLVHGAAGGVGTAGVQLAKAMGARVIAVVSSEAKGKVAQACGADETVPTDGFRAAVKELTGGRGVDVVLDPVGGERFTDSLRSLAPEGRLLVVGFTGGEIPTVRVNRLLLNNLDLVGVGWGAFALPRASFMAEQWERLRPFLEAGALDPYLGGSYPLDQTAAALREMAERRLTGKLTLAVRP
ncbi:MAG: NADPH:quinone oxidoreductase family protein [Frankia sp.]